MWVEWLQVTQSWWQAQNCLEPDSRWVWVLPHWVCSKFLARLYCRGCWEERRQQRVHWPGLSGLSGHPQVSWVSGCRAVMIAPRWGACRSCSGVKGSCLSPERQRPSFPASKLLPRAPALSPESQHLCFKALGFPGGYRGPSHRPCPRLPPRLKAGIVVCL